MTFWTFLYVIMLSDRGQPINFGTFESVAACEAAIQDRVAGIEGDFLIRCHESSVASGSIRPRRRP